MYKKAGGGTYSGSWLNHKKHGFGVSNTAGGKQKFGLYNQGVKIRSFTAEEANKI